MLEWIAFSFSADALACSSEAYREAASSSSHCAPKANLSKLRASVSMGTKRLARSSRQVRPTPPPQILLANALRAQ